MTACSEEAPLLRDRIVEAMDTLKLNGMRASLDETMAASAK